MEQDLVKQDINLLEFPLYVINPRSDHNIFVIETGKGKYTYKAAKDDIPDSTDALLLYCLLHKSQKEKECQIELSKYELAKRAGLSICQKSYERIEKSLYRWLNVSIKFDGSFYEKKSYVSKGFHILNYEINKKEKKIKVSFNNEFYKIIKESQFFKYVKLSYYKALKKPLSRRLYEYLLKQFVKEASFSINIKTLAEKMTITSSYPSEIERSLKPALKEINSYLKDYNVDLKVYKNQSEESIAEFSKTSPNVGVTSFKLIPCELPESIQTIIPSKLLTSNVIKLINYYLKNGTSEEYILSNIYYSVKRFKTNFLIYLKKALLQDYAHDERELAIKEREFAEKQKKLLEEEARIALEREKLKEEKEAKEQERIYFIVTQLPEHDRKKIESLAAEDMRKFNYKKTITEKDKMLYTSIAYKKLGYDRSSNS